MKAKYRGLLLLVCYLFSSVIYAEPTISTSIKSEAQRMKSQQIGFATGTVISGIALINCAGVLLGYSASHTNEGMKAKNILGAGTAISFIGTTLFAISTGIISKKLKGLRDLSMNDIDTISKRQPIEIDVDEGNESKHPMTLEKYYQPIEEKKIEEEGDTEEILIAENSNNYPEQEVNPDEENNIEDKETTDAIEDVNIEEHFSPEETESPDIGTDQVNDETESVEEKYSGKIFFMENYDYMLSFLQHYDGFEEMDIKSISMKIKGPILFAQAYLYKISIQKTQKRNEEPQYALFFEIESSEWYFLKDTIKYKIDGEIQTLDGFSDSKQRTSRYSRYNLTTSVATILYPDDIKRICDTAIDIPFRFTTSEVGHIDITIPILFVQIAAEYFQ